jgi:HK97 family phage major capsid protein
MTLEELRAAHRNAVRRLEDAGDAIGHAKEGADLTALRSEFDAAEEGVERYDRQLARARVDDRTGDAGAEERAQRVIASERRYAAGGQGGELRITGQAGPYHRGSGNSFLGDLLRVRDGDGEARERLLTNSRRTLELRGLTSIAANSGSEFVVPAEYLGSDYAAYRDAGRPLLNAIGTKPLDPSIPSIRIPRVTTGVSVTANQTEGSAYSTGDISTDQAVGLAQATGHYADLSRQLIERSNDNGAMDEVVLSDQLRAVNLRLDLGALSGSGTAPAHLGLLNVSSINTSIYTDASPRQTAWLTAFGKAIQSHVANNVSATLAVLHPRRWAWLLQAVDTTNRPLIEPTAYSAQNAQGVTVPGGAYQGPVGTLFGVPIIVDGNITSTAGAGTNEDYALILEHTELRIWEGPPRVAIEWGVLVHQGQVRLVTFVDAVMILNRRPAAITKMSGTGFAGTP